MFSSLTIGRLAMAFYRHFIRLFARSHTDGASHTWPAITTAAKNPRSPRRVSIDKGRTTHPS